MKRKRKSHQTTGFHEHPRLLTWRELTLEQAKQIVAKYGPMEHNLIGTSRMQLDHARARLRESNRQGKRRKGL